MIDSRRIASCVDAEHVGPSVDLSGFNSLDAATGRDLAFCVYDDADYVRETDAAAVFCTPEIGPVEDCTQLLSADPRTAFAIATNALFTEDRPDGTDVHPTAFVHDDAEVGDGTRVGPHASVGAAVRIGDDCTIRAGVRIGGAGFGFGRDGDDVPHRLPHRGTVRIEDGVEIGPNTTIDRAVFEETVVGQNAKLSGNVHVAHQVQIGRNTTVAYGAGFSGRVTVGEAVTVHPHVAVADGVHIGDGAEIGINSTVLDDIPEGETVVGSPARATSEVMAR